MKNSSVESKKKSMKSEKGMESRKKVFVVLVAVVLVLAVVLVVYPLINKGGIANSTNKLAEEKSFQSYKLKETTISYEQDTTVFNTKVENIGTEVIPAGAFNIILLDKDEKELTSIGVYLKEMQPAEVIETKAVIAEKVENIYDMKIVREETTQAEM